MNEGKLARFRQLPYGMRIDVNAAESLGINGVRQHYRQALASPHPVAPGR